MSSLLCYSVFLHSKPNVAYESTKKFSEIISEFSKVAGYRIGIQKPIIFLKPFNEQFKNKIKKTISFIIYKKIKRNKFNPKSIKLIL